MNIIQVNIINNYSLMAFPADIIKTLISELNVHYGKINNYIEMEVASEKINIEFIDAHAKLSEIIRLSPNNIGQLQYSDDYKLSTDILDSILALLKIIHTDDRIQNKLKTLGFKLVERVYGSDIRSHIINGLLYRWLDKNKLITKNNVYMSSYSFFGYPDGDVNKPKKKRFEPSDDELNSFYESSKSEIYRLMVDEKNEFSNFLDPFGDERIKDFYHYYYSLDSIGVNKSS